MPAIRFRSRHLHATIYNHFVQQITTLGWVNAPVNFGTEPVVAIDYQPEERNESIKHNTVSVSLGDYGQDEEEELGALDPGGLRSALYTVYIDIYMAEQALSLAMADDVRDIFDDIHLPLVNQITGQPVPATVIEVEAIYGPERPPANVAAEAFKRHWRIMRVEGRLFYST